MTVEMVAAVCDAENRHREYFKSQVLRHGNALLVTGDRVPEDEEIQVPEMA